MKDFRKEQLAQWIAKVLAMEPPTLKVISGDASFRRYFRFKHNSQNVVAVDAPPKTENNRSFYQISKKLLNLALNVPVVQHIDLANGFMLLSDLGDQLFLDQLNEQSSDGLYCLAIDAIVNMQLMSGQQLENIPIYNKQLLEQELQLFRNWFLEQHLQITISKQENKIIEQAFKSLVDNALSQPQVFCHSDFHSRNLMICGNKTPGIIDFQDAVIGPITFDLVSLLKDCYIKWSREKVEKWCQYYFQKAKNEDLFDTTWGRFISWFDLMGLHRHIRVLGVFSRLNYRDGKSDYLNDLPLTFSYITDTCERYPQFYEFSQFLQNRVRPEI